MRALLRVLTFGVALLGLLAPACSSSDSTPDDTCGFLGDANNCYRRLIADVEACLTDNGADAGFLQGTLSADGTSCAYASGRTVTFVGDARQYDASKTPMDVTVTLNGKTCVHFVSQPQRSFAFTGPGGGTLKVAVSGFGETITCPDGSQHGIDGAKVFGGCGDAGGIFSGGLPGTSTSGGGSSVSGSLVGMANEAYACKAP